MTRCRWPKLEKIKTHYIDKKFAKNHPNLKSVILDRHCQDIDDEFPNLESLIVMENSHSFTRPLSNGNESFFII